MCCDAKVVQCGPTIFELACEVEVYVKSLNQLSQEIRSLAEKVVTGKLSEHDLNGLTSLPPEMFERFEFVRVLAGGNPEQMAALISVAQHSLNRDLSGEALPGHL